LHRCQSCNRVYSRVWKETAPSGLKEIAMRTPEWLSRGAIAPAVVGVTLRSQNLNFLASAVIVAGSVLATALPAEAGASTGTWRNGMVASPYGAGQYGAPGGYSGARRGLNDEGYGGAPVYAQQECYTRWQRVADAWGRIVVRRVRICE
jgi:hypothetical protein